MRESKLYNVAKAIVRPLYYPLFRPKIRGQQNFAKVKTGAVIVAGNHISPIDAVTTGELFPRNLHFLAKVSLAHNPQGVIFRHAGLVFVDRDIKNHAITAAEEYLANGMAIAIFPEGTCNPKFKKFNELLPFKFGAVKMAADTGAPILPIAISRKYAPFGERLKVNVGQPFFVAKDENLEIANEKLRDVIVKLLTENGVKAVKLPGRPAKNPAKNPPILDDDAAKKEVKHV